MSIDLICLPEIAELLRVSERTARRILDAAEAAGEIAPLTLTKRLKRWDRSVVHAWLAARVEALNAEMEARRRVLNPPARPAVDQRSGVARRPKQPRPAAASQSAAS